MNEPPAGSDPASPGYADPAHPGPSHPESGSADSGSTIPSPAARARPALSADEGICLARLASAAVAAKLAGAPPDDQPPASGRLREPGASFVTLETHGRLRGCIGSLRAIRPLYLDVTRNARRATIDPRLPPVTGAEWADLAVSVSVLSDPSPLPAGELVELVAALRPGLDGLILTDGNRRATFLPAVWRKVADPEQFVQALLAKGGWPPGEWPAGIRAARYTSAEFVDAPPRAALS
ncbi:AmmeMemoRadiSam system protein A [Rugosimonospora africana]|uniref:AmmeMemoRadiSam system protein A n=1 Tax=Rugosimonospora africana TaxID=556532 RepID=A0A8J3QJR4_9ACTN|nr:AmmeMemoRadiSam system protein A [Rugosimonospora africana]GIH12270.1 AmmeMemoRadiSam system protein A [Rugosimonospora africana]